MRFIVLISLIVFLPATVVAQQRCGEFKTVRATILNKWKEIPTHLGRLRLYIPTQSRTVDVFVVTFTNKNTRTFSIVRVYPKGIPSPFAGLACIEMTGFDLHYNPAPEKEIGKGAGGFR